jgi:hypothetical protein
MCPHTTEAARRLAPAICAEAKLVDEEGDMVVLVRRFDLRRRALSVKK